MLQVATDAVRFPPKMDVEVQFNVVKADGGSRHGALACMQQLHRATARQMPIRGA